MFNHAPVGYVCPFCRLVEGGEDEHRKQHEQDFAPAGQRLPYSDRLRKYFASTSRI